MEKLPEVKREEVKEPVNNKISVSDVVVKPFKELSKLLTKNNEKENEKNVKNLSSASSGISYPSGIERINDAVEKDKVSLQNSKVLSYLDSIDKGVKLIATNLGNFKLSESESKSSGDFIDNFISNGTDKLIDLIGGRNRERNTRRGRINPRERNRRSRVSNQRQNRGTLGKILSVFGLGNNTENLLDISNSILPIEEQTPIPSGRIEPRPRPTPNRRDGGIVSKILSTAKSELGKVGNLLEGGERLLGKAALPLAIATSLYDAGTSAFNDEEIKKSTGKETVSVGDRISAGVGGTLGGIASIGDTLLSLGGIDSDIGGFIKDTATSSLSKLIDVGTDVINNTFSSDTISNALLSAKETISTQFTNLSESLGTSFNSLLETSSNKIGEISSSIIDKGTSILTSAKESLFSFADSTSTLSNNLLTKTESLLDNSKSFISESISSVSKLSSDGLTKIIDSSKGIISNTVDSISSFFSSSDNTKEKQNNNIIEKSSESKSFISDTLTNVSKLSSDGLTKIIDSSKGIISNTVDSISSFFSSSDNTKEKQNNNISQDKLTEKNIINSSNQLISEKQIETFKNNINSNSNNKEISIKELGNNTDLTRFNTLSSGTLEGIASIGDTLLSLGGIETDIGGFVKETTTTSLSKPSLLSELINNSDNVLEKIISTTSDHIQFLLTNTSSIDLQNNNISQDKLTEKNIINSSNQLISEKQIETFKNNINSNSNNKEISIKELGNNTDLTRFNTLSTSLFNNKETLSTDNFIKLTEVPFDLIQKFLDSFQSNKASDLNNEIAVYTANKVANATAIPIVVPTPAPNVIVNSGNDNDQRTLLKPSIDPSSIRDIMRGFSYSMI